MDEMVLRINDPELCYVFARNARRKGRPELALQAYRRAVELRAEQHDVECEAERRALRAIYAYEEALSHHKGKRTRATKQRRLHYHVGTQAIHMQSSFGNF